MIHCVRCMHDDVQPVNAREARGVDADHVPHDSTRVPIGHAERFGHEEQPAPAGAKVLQHGVGKVRRPIRRGRGLTGRYERRKRPEGALEPERAAEHVEPAIRAAAIDRAQRRQAVGMVLRIKAEQRAAPLRAKPDRFEPIPPGWGVHPRP